MTLLDRIILLFITLISVQLLAQNRVTEGGMSFSYKVVNDSLDISIEAPTSGWLGVGFNAKNDIVGSDLLLFHVVNGKADALDMFVKAIGNPKEDRTIGGSSDIRIISGSESNKSTKVQFKIPFQSRDAYDFKHQINKEFWLILAYSIDDDFGHHSRMRKHISFMFTN